MEILTSIGIDAEIIALILAGVLFFEHKQPGGNPLEDARPV